MVTELLSKSKQSRQHLDIELSNIGVTNEDTQMDLDLYIDLKSIFFAKPDQEKHNAYWGTKVWNIDINFVVIKKHKKMNIKTYV